MTESLPAEIRGKVEHTGLRNGRLEIGVGSPIWAKKGEDWLRSGGRDVIEASLGRRLRVIRFVVGRGRRRRST